MPTAARRASCSSWHSRAPCSGNRRSCCSTSRRARSTRRHADASGRRSTVDATGHCCVASHLDEDVESCDRVFRLGVVPRRGGGGCMIRYAVAAALARRDFEINRSYRRRLRARSLLGRDRRPLLLLLLEDRRDLALRGPRWRAVLFRLRPGRHGDLGRHPLGHVDDLDAGARGAADGDARVHLRQPGSLVRVRARNGVVPVSLRRRARPRSTSSSASRSSASRPTM